MEFDLSERELDEMVWLLDAATKTDLATFLHMWSHLPLHTLTVTVDGGSLDQLMEVAVLVREMQEDFEKNIAPELSSYLSVMSELDRFISNGLPWTHEDRDSWRFKLGSSVSAMRMHVKNMLKFWPDMVLTLPELRIRAGETDSLEEIRDLGYFLTYECALWADRFGRWQRELMELAIAAKQEQTNRRKW